MEKTKYILWLVCLVSFGFLFQLSKIQNHEELSGRNYHSFDQNERIRSKRFLMPNFPNNTEDLKKFVDRLNISSVIDNARKSVSNFTNGIRNFTREIMQNSLLSPRNLTTSPLKVKILNGRDIKNGSVATTLKERIRSSCSNFSESRVENLAKCLSSLSGLGTSFITSFNATVFRVGVNLTLEDSFEYVVFQVSFDNSTSSTQTLEDGVSGGGRGDETSGIENLQNNSGDKDSDPLPNINIPDDDASRARDVRSIGDTATWPKSDDPNWNVFTDNKHLGKPIVVSTFLPRHNNHKKARSKDGAKKSGGVNEKGALKGV